MGKTIKSRTFAVFAGLSVTAVSLLASWVNGNIPLPAVLATSLVLGVATFLATSRQGAKNAS
ncbi:hypothetical protein [Arthrobacter sp. OAP107]|uniref:hypothetical protein n=1 Tax=Arthrobacter sp. OAP107 TaxID=3156445 RepID=UPI0033938AB2